MTFSPFNFSIQSPAERTQKIHAGDEVVQVNRQTVVGHVTAGLGLTYLSLVWSRVLPETLASCRLSDVPSTL